MQTSVNVEIDTNKQSVVFLNCFVSPVNIAVEWVINGDGDRFGTHSRSLRLN